MEPEGSLQCPQGHATVQILRPYVTFHNKLAFYGEKLLAPHHTPKLGNHPAIF